MAQEALAPRVVATTLPPAKARAERILNGRKPYCFSTHIVFGEQVMRALRYIAISAAFIIATSVSVPAIALAPKAGDRVAVVFPPWTDAAAASERIWRAGGAVLTVSGSSAVALGSSDAFLWRLRRAGALFIFDAASLAALCGQPSAQPMSDSHASEAEFRSRS